jgi:hypothetical protein
MEQLEQLALIMLTPPFKTASLEIGQYCFPESSRLVCDLCKPSRSSDSTPCFTIVNMWVMRPANYFKKRPAWIIEWHTYREDSPIRSFRPHILPWRWRSEKVADYMRCLYWNSGLWTPFEIIVRVNKREPEGILIERALAPLVYGDGACRLVASVVSHKRLELFLFLRNRGRVQPGLICSNV